MNLGKDQNKSKLILKKKRIKKTEIKNIFYLIILIISIITFIFSSYKIIIYFSDLPKTKKLIVNIKDNTKVVEYDSTTAEIVKSEEKSETQYQDFTKINLIDVDFKEIKKINSETVAWLYVSDTNINYPVVQTNNNDFYLTHSFDKSKNVAGWIFMDFRNPKDDYGKNTIIYGHNMKDQTMFGSLKKTLLKEWYQKEENRIIKMSSEKYNTLWQIYSVYILKTTNDYIQTKFASDDEYQKFINLVKNRSITNFNTNVNTSDKTLTLSTCHGSEKKLVVHAKLIKIEAK